MTTPPAPLQPAKPPAAQAFGPFVIDWAAGRLTREGQPVKLAPRPFDLLCHLLRHAGQLVSKDDLLDAVWGHRHVSESVLKGAINSLRSALDDDVQTPRWIATVPRRGYRFVAALTPAEEPGPFTTAPPSVPPTAPPPAPPSAPPALSTRSPEPARVAPGNLPAAAEALIGRDSDLAELQGLLASHRVLTLLGPGGIGKTRLALAAAAQAQAHHPDGVWLVRLDALADGDALVGTIARTLRLSAEAAHSTDSLAAALRTLRLLLVLDNCEHLLDAVARCVQPILGRAPGLRLLVTSQAPLQWAGERVLRVSPLACPPSDDALGATSSAAAYGAVALFVHRVQGLDASFALDDTNRATVSALCNHLDGLPLALELAAARVPLMGVAGVHDRLADRLALLTRGARDAAPRHRTLRDTLAWSHDLLTPRQQAVLHRLSVFQGSFSLDAAQSIAGSEGPADWSVLDDLQTLVEKSLVVSLPGTPMRLRLYDSVRAYATEHLAQAGATLATRGRHATWMLSMMAGAAARVHDEAQLPWVQGLLPDVDNLRTALRHNLTHAPAEAVALFNHSVLFWLRAGFRHEVLGWRDAVRPAAEQALPPAVQAGFAQAQASICVYGMQSLPPQAVANIELAVQTHLALGDTLNAYFDLYLLHHLMMRAQPEADRSRLWPRMLALEGTDWSPMRRRYARWLTAMALREAGNKEGYRQFCLGEVAHHRHAGDRSGEWSATYGLALAEHDRGQTPAAIALLQASMQDMRDAGCLREQTNTVAMLVSLLLTHSAETARSPLVPEALALLQADGSLWCTAYALPMAAWWQDRPQDSARLQGWADAQVASRGETAGLFYARLRQQCLAHLGQAFTPAQRQTLADEGATLDEAAALRLVFGP